MSDILKKLSNCLSYTEMLRMRLMDRSRTEYFYPGSAAPELLRQSEECFEECKPVLTDAWDEITRLRRQNQDLIEANIRFERRSRDGEAEVARQKKLNAEYEATIAAQAKRIAELETAIRPLACKEGDCTCAAFDYDNSECVSLKARALLTPEQGVK